MRKESFKALVGSHNYNLTVPESDKDFKVFFIPSYDDLYSGEKYSKAMISDKEDIEYHDIRKLPDMLWKSNVNFLEVLFSQEVYEYDDLYRILHNRREEIARMNLPYLYDACMGMFFKKKKEFERVYKSNNLNKSCKHVMSAVRIVDFLKRYVSNKWGFQKAVFYSANEFTRKKLLNIRRGKYQSKDELQALISESELLLKKMKDVYKEQKEDYDIKEWVYETVKEHVKSHLIEELG
ncbi:DNA polymerase beta superfamily protein [Bacillus smithii]|uniref:DNA polymerase beta superfamily protein n=1 Tax=Bacillus smithii TaxID=1479 RepID=UPI003D1EBE85